MAKAGTTEIRHAEGQAQGRSRPLGRLRAEWRFEGAKLRLEAAKAEYALAHWELEDAAMKGFNGKHVRTTVQMEHLVIDPPLLGPNGSASKHQ